MDFNDIKNLAKFLNWEMIGAISLFTMATIQFFKEAIPDKYGNIPILKISTLVAGMIWAHLLFDISGVKHTESIALVHGAAGPLIASLGYEVLKGTKLGLRSSDEIKKP